MLVDANGSPIYRFLQPEDFELSDFINPVGKIVCIPQPKETPDANTPE